MTQSHGDENGSKEPQIHKLSPCEENRIDMKKFNTPLKITTSEHCRNEEPLSTIESHFVEDFAPLFLKTFSTKINKHSN